MKKLGIHTTFMKTVLIFGLIIVGARAMEMLNAYTQIPHFIVVECMVLIIAFSILTYGIYDYNKMLKKQTVLH